jgi:hypothetical protein
MVAAAQGGPEQEEQKMTKFMVLYRSTVSAQEQMAGATPEQGQAGMDAWMAWAGKAGDAIVDLGAPLSDAAWVGPASAADSMHITGFSILQAESADALTAILDGHPHLGMGGSIEVLEFLVIPGM